MCSSLKFIFVVTLLSVAVNGASVGDYFICASCQGKIGSACDFDEFDEMAPAVMCSLETYDNSTCISFTYKDSESQTYIVRGCGEGYNCEDNLPIADVPLDYCQVCNTSGCNDEVFH